MLLDRRRKGRTTVFQPAKVVAADTDLGDACIVDNLTLLGARVTGTAADLPNKFDLTFDNGHTYWSCRVIWRNRNGQVGVTWKTG